MTVSLGAHISDASRAKLKAYQGTHEFKNVSDALEHLIEHTNELIEHTESDPNQTTLPGCES